MPKDRRRKDTDWQLPAREDGESLSVEAAQLAVLMDLRDELKRLNDLLRCENFLSIPRVLRRISRNTAKPRKAKA